MSSPSIAQMPVWQLALFPAGVQFAKPDEAAIESFVAKRAAAQA